MTFDGISFNDANGPTHHSSAWFPTPFIGSTVFDRSPGDATAIGPSNAGRSPTRAQLAQFGDNYLFNNNPNDPFITKFNFYQIPTDFDYLGLNLELGGGWRFEDNVYSNRYYDVVTSTSNCNDSFTFDC